METQGTTQQEKKALRNKRYWDKHTKEINARRQVRIRCDCGMEVSKQHLARHLANSLHKKEMEKQRQVLEDRTNPTIAKLTMSFLQVAFRI